MNDHKGVESKPTQTLRLRSIERGGRLKPERDVPETSIAPNDDFGSKNLHNECFKYSILAPVFPAQDFTEVIDFDSREWMVNSSNEMKLITEPDKILNILTDSIVLETGLVDNNDEKTAGTGNVFRYFAKFANRLTILSTSPMRFVRL